MEEEQLEVRVLPATPRTPALGWVALALDVLAPTEVWALDRLDRFIWTLGITRQLETLAVLGCWVINPSRFACVFRSVELGTFGLVVDQDPDGDACLAAADRLGALSLCEVEEWRGRGWIKDGVTWDREPHALVTPWAVRPPDPGDPLSSPGGDHSWSTQPPSTNPDPVEAAIDDLQRRVVHDLWSSTALTLLITYPTGYARSALRLSAAWVCAPDSFAYVETHLWPPTPDHPHDAAELARLRLPGQQYLRFGEYIAPISTPAQAALIRHRHGDMELDGSMAYPRGVDQYRTTLRDGILWDQGRPPATYETDREASRRMGSVLHNALDVSPNA
jgi:hypothetical protein